MPLEKFTAGPWVKNDNGTVVNKQGFIVAQSKSDDTGRLTEIEKSANAQLISAAPEMYAFIKDLHDQAQRNGAIYPTLEKVYNKALGIS